MRNIEEKFLLFKIKINQPNNHGRCKSCLFDRE